MAIRGRRAHLIIALLSALVVASCGAGGGDDGATAAVTSGDGSGNGSGDGNGGLPPGQNQRPDPTPPGGGDDDPAGGGDRGGGGDSGSPPVDDPPILYKAEAGPDTEATPVIMTLHDPARDKDLDLRVSWPVEGGTLPLVIFSHGNDGSMLAYDPLITHWVSHGYVLIQPDHLDSYLVPIEDRAQEHDDWEDRIHDVVFILDSLDQIQADIPALAGRIDRDRIGVGGHSFGAHTAQLVSGVVMANESFLDSRIKAALLISPQGLGDTLDEDSWSAFTNPMMVITGTNDTGRDGEPWTWRMDPYNYAPADGRKHAVVIAGAYHNFGDIYGIGDLPDAGPPDPTQVSYVRSASVAFLDAYLKQLPDAQAYLAGEDMEVATGDEIDYQHK